MQMGSGRVGFAGPGGLEAHIPDTLPSHMEVGHKGFGPCFVHGNSVSKDPGWESVFILNLKAPRGHLGGSVS